MDHYAVEYSKEARPAYLDPSHPVERVSAQDNRTDKMLFHLACGGDRGWVRCCSSH